MPWDRAARQTSSPQDDRSAAGGTPQKTWQSKDRAEVFSFHPDGKQIAVAIYVMELEIRVIKNLVQELEKLTNEPRFP